VNHYRATPARCDFQLLLRTDQQSSTQERFSKEQSHTQRPSELIGVVPLARAGERAVNRDLAGIDFADHTTPLSNDTDDILS
jgi:hypothetical protein